jgi:hypothetical protein
MLLSSTPARECDLDGCDIESATCSAPAGLYDGPAPTILDVAVHAEDIRGCDNPMLILPVVLTAKNLPLERPDNYFLPVLPTVTATTSSESFKIIICSTS